MPKKQEVRALTRRQIEVLELAAGGLSNRQIATKLGISVHTVHAHLKNIKEITQDAGNDSQRWLCSLAMALGMTKEKIRWERASQLAELCVECRPRFRKALAVSRTQ